MKRRETGLWVYTDSVSYAECVLGGPQGWEGVHRSALTGQDRTLVEALLEDDTVRVCLLEADGLWQRLILTQRAARSQFDTLLELLSGNLQIPEGVLCLAGSGSKFHGQRDRPWVSLPGNIHLSAHLTPRMSAQELGVGLSILPALALLDAIDSCSELANRSTIKWVNDVLIDSAKVAGFLTQTRVTEGRVDNAVMGIGLNVETTPNVQPDPFAPAAASLRDFLRQPEPCTQASVFARLRKCLGDRYRQLQSGDVPGMLAAYRRRSLVMGRQVSVRSDWGEREELEIARGRVVGIGDNLELFLEGVEKPVTRGRLILLE